MADVNYSQMTCWNLRRDWCHLAFSYQTITCPSPHFSPRLFFPYSFLPFSVSRSLSFYRLVFPPLSSFHHTIFASFRPFPVSLSILCPSDHISSHIITLNYEWHKSKEGPCFVMIWFNPHIPERHVQLGHDAKGTGTEQRGNYVKCSCCCCCL